MTGVSAREFSLRRLLVSSGPYESCTITSIVLPIEPLGASRYPARTLLDLRAQKAARIGAQRVSVRADLHNALNANVVTSLSTQSGTNLEKSLAIMASRIAVFGLT